MTLGCVTSGKLNHHQLIMDRFAFLLHFMHISLEVLPFQLSSVVFYVKMASLNCFGFKLAVAPGEDVTVPTILGLVDEKALKMYL
jgi:hypothetical protein